MSVAPGGSFDPGIYRLINYDGTRTGPGLAINSLPAGVTHALVQTSVPGQVNLVNFTGVTGSFWDGGGNLFDGIIGGGNGVWRVGGSSPLWTDEIGALNGLWEDEGFAVFMATPGTVSVDDAGGVPKVSGMQFAVNGYRLQGDAVELSAPETIIRVGDGTAAGEGMTATIDSVLAGAGQLVKADRGTLVLGGANAYAGGTRIEAGTLQVADNANLGAGGTALSFGTGRLHATASFTLARNVVLDNTATFDIDVGKTLSIPNPVSGDGRLVKSGAGTLLISGNVTHAGGTLIEEGTLQIGNSTGSGSLAGDVENHGVLAFDYDLGTGTHIYAGRITGDGILRVREGAVQLT